MTHSENCILANKCRAADTEACNALCQHYLIMHGQSGAGGRIGAACLPRDYRLVTVQNSPVRVDQPEVYKTIDAYVKTFVREYGGGGEPIKSLYLYSESPGTGKTTTAAAILNEYIMRHYFERSRRGERILERPALFVDVNEWQTLYNEFNRPRVPDSIAEPAARRYYEIMEAAKSVPFAVLDDIGVRAPSEGFRADLHTIINARVTNLLPTVYTSNIPISGLAAVFGEERLADRVADLCAQLTFVGGSKRGMR